MVRPAVSELIVAEHPEWTNEGYLCLNDLNRYRGQYVQKVLETEQGELTSLEEEVLLSMRQHDLLAANVDDDFDDARTLGQRIADGVAQFGGSWTFIISFGIVLTAWILINTHLVLNQPFDPFPFILLNLVLSCLAAIQAPVIMMSQNRQEAKDRLRGEHDYQVNLKAELEIRQLHSKLDLMMTHQWHRLLEIQQVQTDLLQELMQQNAARQNPLPGARNQGDSSPK
ncbi:MAG: DUF1003 domain-containing protein [Planctomycetaceae bacterium]